MAAIAMNSVILYSVVVLIAVGSVVAATDIALAVMYAREHYRRHPELDPPNRYLVRLFLRGTR